MPRPRKGITSANFLQVDRYFTLALRDNRLFDKSTKGLSILHQAKEAFNRLPNINWSSPDAKKTSIAKRQAALQEWVDNFIPPNKWQRCLLTLRQNKSRKKLKLRRVDLPLEVYLTVKALAQKQELSLAETIFKLAKPAFNRLYKKEFAKEIGLK